MTSTASPTGPIAGRSAYEIRVAGRFDPELFADDDVRVSAAGSAAVLRVSVADHAALHGLLHRVRSAGLRLVELHRLPEEA